MDCLEHSIGRSHCMGVDAIMRSTQRRVKMNTISITLPATLPVTSRDTVVSVDMASLTADIVTKLVVHGLTQKVGDAAASALADAGFKGMKYADLTAAQQAEVQKNAKDAMQKVADALTAGDWGIERTGAAGVSALAAERRMVLRSDVKAGWIAEHGESGWKALEEAEIVEMLDATYDAQDADTQTAIDGVAQARLDAKAAAKTASKGLAGLIKMPAKK